MDADYKPGFIGWVLTIFVAAGFGNVFASLFQEKLNRTLQKPGSLEYADISCWNKTLKNILIPLCEFAFKNVGDEEVLVTAITIDGATSQRFQTNYPGNRDSIAESQELASFALVPAKKHLVIKARVEEKNWGKAKVCLITNGKKSKPCVNWNNDN